MVQVELIYIPDDGSIFHQHLFLEPGATVEDVLNASGVYTRHPEAKGFAIGIFSKQVPLHSLVKSGDRVEIYRPLVLDPKEKRRQRAKVKS